MPPTSAGSRSSVHNRTKNAAAFPRPAPLERPTSTTKSERPLKALSGNLSSRKIEQRHRPGHDIPDESGGSHAKGRPLPFAPVPFIVVTGVAQDDRWTPIEDEPSQSVQLGDRNGLPSQGTTTSCPTSCPPSVAGCRFAGVIWACRSSRLKSLATGFSSPGASPHRPSESRHPPRAREPAPPRPAESARRESFPISGWSFSRPSIDSRGFPCQSAREQRASCHRTPTVRFPNIPRFRAENPKGSRGRRGILC